MPKTKEKIKGRIRYVENAFNEGEHYLFELFDNALKLWGLDTAYKIADEKVSWEALAKIRDWQKNGVEIQWE